MTTDQQHADQQHADQQHADQQGAGDHLDVRAVLAELSLEEKAALLDGSDFWRTTPVDRLGVPALLLSDGPHGLRTQKTGGDHLGLEQSATATCFPPAAALASTWDPRCCTGSGWPWASRPAGWTCRCCSGRG